MITIDYIYAFVTYTFSVQLGTSGASNPSTQHIMQHLPDANVGCEHLDKIRHLDGHW